MGIVEVEADPCHDTHLVTKLRAAGFVFVARTNAPELGTIPSTEPLAFGPTMIVTAGLNSKDSSPYERNCCNRTLLIT